MQRKLLGIINVDSDATGQLLIIYVYSAFGKYLRKNGNTMKQCISSLQTSRKLKIQLGEGEEFKYLGTTLTNKNYIQKEIKSRILDKILYVVGKSDMPLQLLQSVLSPFLWIGTIIDPFHSSGSSSLFQIEIISLWIAQRIVPPTALISSAGI